MGPTKMPYLPIPLVCEILQTPTCTGLDFARSAQQSIPAAALIADWAQTTLTTPLLDMLLPYPAQTRRHVCHEVAATLERWSLSSGTGLLTRQLVELVARFREAERQMIVCNSVTPTELWGGMTAAEKGLHGRVGRAAGAEPADTTLRVMPATMTLDESLDKVRRLKQDVAHVANTEGGVWENVINLPLFTRSPAVDQFAVDADGETPVEAASAALAWLAPTFSAAAPLHVQAAEYAAVAFASAAMHRRGGKWHCRRSCQHNAPCGVSCRAAHTALMLGNTLLKSCGLQLGAAMRELARVTGSALVADGVVAVFYPAAAAACDYVAGGYKLRPVVVAEDEPLNTQPLEESFATHVSPEWAKATYIRGDVPDAKIMQLTLTTVFTALAREPTDWERGFLWTNRGYDEWACAATLLTMTCMAAPVRTMIERSNYVNVPLQRWSKGMKEWINAVRRCPYVWGCEDATKADWAMFRKFGNVTIRNTKEADWDGDLEARTRDLPFHCAVRADGMCSRGLWESEQEKFFTRQNDEIVATTAEESNLMDLDDWWASRYAWMPNGSSSMRHLADPVTKDLSVDADPQARASKKAVCEQLDSDFPALIYAQTPFVEGRGSEKHEPGEKNRPLHAADDPTFVATAYASVHLEKNMNQNGIKARQTPADVVDWQQDSLRAPGDTRYASADYADYNETHTLQTLAVNNLTLAAAWQRAPVPLKVRAHKELAATWAGMSQFNKWTTTRRGTERVSGGLFSGDRDTARDNTGLHRFYAQIGLANARVYDNGAEFVTENYTGDDEDNRHRDWISIFWYLCGLETAGFPINAKKQAVGEHEFLQRLIIDNGMAIRPLCASIGAFASGNWYKDKHMWYDSAVQSASDALWDMVARGMPLDLGRALAVETLNAAMRVPVHAADGTRTWKRLEWWGYRHGWSGEGDVVEHPLWWGSEGTSMPCPTIAAKPAAAAEAPGNASAAWVASISKRLHIPKNIDLSAYEAECRKEGYASIYVLKRADTHRKFALDEWPERTSQIRLGTAPSPPRATDAEVKKLILTHSTGQRPVTIEDVYGRMGVDGKLVTLLGGLAKILSWAPPELMRYYEAPTPVKRGPTALRWHDPAVVSWYGGSAYASTPDAVDPMVAIARRWPRRALSTPDDHRVLTLILAPNAAGKTTWALDNVHSIDVDAIITATSSQGQLHADTGRTATHMRSPVASIVSMSMRRLGATVVTTQMPAALVFDPAQLNAARLRITIVTPPLEVVVERLEARGWTRQRALRRLAQWSENVRYDMQHDYAPAAATVNCAATFDDIDALGQSKRPGTDYLKQLAQYTQSNT